MHRETAIQGHSRSSVVVPIDAAYMTSYQIGNAIVNRQYFSPFRTLSSLYHCSLVVLLLLHVL